MASLLSGSSHVLSSNLIMGSSCHTLCTWMASLPCGSSHHHRRETVEMQKVWHDVLGIRWPWWKMRSPHRRETIFVPKVWQEVLRVTWHEETWENPQLAKFHERSQWREGVQEHQMSFSESGDLKKTNEPSTGEVSWGDSHRREGIQVHKVLQELLYIKLLEIHERIHSGGIQFKCTKCDKCFQHKVPWRIMRGPTQGRSLSNAQNVTRASRNRTS